MHQCYEKVYVRKYVYKDLPQAKTLSLHLQYSIVMPTGATKGINNVYVEIYVYVIIY